MNSEGRRKRSSIFKILGGITSQRGEDSEQAVLSAMTPSEGNELPSWIKRARRATRDEDKKGVDIVITTDVGDIRLQVKSSQRGADEFRNLYPESTIKVIVVKSVVESTRIKREAIHLVSEERRRLLLKRQRTQGDA